MPNNPINPQTRQPWTDQQMAYFRLLQQNSATDPGFAARSERYLASVATPNPQTGAPQWMQGADPYQVAGGETLIQDKALRDEMAARADIARQDMALKQQAREDAIRRNPENAAIYEQERRGWRAGPTGNETADQYAAGPGGAPASAPVATAPVATAPAAASLGGYTPGLGINSVTGAPKVMGHIGSASLNPQTGQYEFSTTGAGDTNFSVDKATGAAIAGGNYGTRPGSDDSYVTTAGGGYSKADMGAAVNQLNQNIARLTPEAAQAFANFDAAKAVPGLPPGQLNGGYVDIPGYLDGAYGAYMAAQAGQGAPALKSGGQVTVGGVPHWIVDDKGNPVAALSEDGKNETVKGKGGVEVIPQDPARKAAYEASKTRPGAAAGNSGATLSGKTTQSKEVNARTTGAKAGDKRVNNGKTNNGRPPAPGSDLPHGEENTDKDAKGVRRVVRGIPGDAAGSRLQRTTPIPVRTSLTAQSAGQRKQAIPKVTQGPMGPGATTLPVRQPDGSVQPYRPAPSGAVVPMFRGAALTPSTMPMVAGHAMGTLPPEAYGGLGGASNAFVNSGQGTSTDFMNKMLAYNPTAPQAATPVTNAVSAQPVAGSTPIPQASSSDPFNINGAPAMNASGGSRVIGNDTAPQARFGFDKNAPIDIAAHNASRGIPGMPGVRVAQPWKIAPRTLMQNGAAGNQLLQSYWNASGAAPSDLTSRLATPGQAGSSNRYV